MCQSSHCRVISNGLPLCCVSFVEGAITQLIKVNLAPFVLVCQVSKLLFKHLTYHSKKVLKVIVVLSFLIIAGQFFNKWQQK